MNPRWLLDTRGRWPGVYVLILYCRLDWHSLKQAEFDRPGELQQLYGAVLLTRRKDWCSWKRRVFDARWLRQ
jgi:hypothetical protein